MATLSRRTLIKALAAAPAAAALPAMPALGSTPPAFIPGPDGNWVSPDPTTKAWRWWYGDGEVFRPADSREDAIALAQDEGQSSVCEAYQAQYDVSVNIEQLIDSWCDQNSDLNGDGEHCLHDVITKEARADLETILNSAVRAWVHEHKIDLTAWCFAETRNQMDIPHE